MKSHFITAQDNARLHIATWNITKNKVPVICLAGLTRNATDFSQLAQELDHPIFAFDYRGRGLSTHNEKLEDYSLQQEQMDLRHCFKELGLTQAIFVGTSRGGIHTMLMPEFVVASVINDIGPDVEMRGLLKIKASLSKRDVTPTNYDEAVTLLKSLLIDEFPNTPLEAWKLLARGIWFEEGKGLKLAYDPKIRDILKDVTPETPMASLWPAYANLAARPCFTLRGEHSQLLSIDTFNKMISYNELTSGYEVKGQGHAPIMWGEVNEKIIRFIKELS